MNEPPDEIKYQFKIILLGDGGVGKTCLTNRFCFNEFNINTRLTIGLAFNTYSINGLENGKPIKIGAAIWDFGGQERFRPLIPQFIAGAHGAILTYESVVVKSLVNLHSQWAPLLEKYTGDIPRILVGTKYDLSEDSQIITKEMIQEYQEKLTCQEHFLTSSKTGHNVKNVFFEVLEKIIEKEYTDVKLIRDKEETLLKNRLKQREK